jgi:DNA primase
MQGDVQSIKDRIDIVDLLSGYIKLEKAGVNYKARCPFHNEKTASFHISPERQTYYCFGCGEKGDAFTFVEKMEGTDFRGALKLLAEKAGIELQNVTSESKGDKERLFETLDEARKFFEENLQQGPEALAYVKSRGITDESIKRFQIGYAPSEWRLLRAHMLAKGFTDDELEKSGLTKRNDEKGSEPYDVFRGRIIFPLSDASGRVIAFSGRSLDPDAVPKYLNTPETTLFLKGEVLYGLDKAKDAIRKKNYAVLVEGQMDLVLSHQAGVSNTVASSGTAFTEAHLLRLKRLSTRLILAFDADSAGEKAAEKSTMLGLGLGMEVKIAKMPEGKDPADLVRDSADSWKEVLRRSVMAIEFFLDLVRSKESDPRKLGKLIEKSILPLIVLLPSAIERSHFVSVVAKRTSIREEVLWEDLKRVKMIPMTQRGTSEVEEVSIPKEPITYKARIEERLAEIAIWKKDLKGKDEIEVLRREEKELENNLELEILKSELSQLMAELSKFESLKDDSEVERLTKSIQAIHSKLKKLEESRKVL